ncbi:MAG: hypothetical protein WC119_00585 [Synergistaceae bacterium]
MRVIVTAKEMLDSGKWETFCEIKGLSPYCINEGPLTSDEEFSLNSNECAILGIGVPILPECRYRACEKCGSELIGEYCNDKTCPYSDWPQDVAVEDLCELSTLAIENKYKITKRAI